MVNDVEGKPHADDFVVLNLLPRGIMHTDRMLISLRARRRWEALFKMQIEQRPDDAHKDQLNEVRVSRTLVTCNVSKYRKR